MLKVAECSLALVFFLWAVQKVVSTGISLGRGSISVQHGNNVCYRASCKGRGMAYAYVQKDI